MKNVLSGQQVDFSQNKIKNTEKNQNRRWDVRQFQYVHTNTDSNKRKTVRFYKRKREKQRFGLLYTLKSGIFTTESGTELRTPPTSFFVFIIFSLHFCICRIIFDARAKNPEYFLSFLLLSILSYDNFFIPFLIFIFIVRQMIRHILKHVTFLLFVLFIYLAITNTQLWNSRKF